MQFKKELFYVSMTDIHALSQAKVVKKVRRAPDVKGGKQERQADRSDLNPIRFHISIYTADNKKKTSMLSFSLFFFSLRLHALHQLPLFTFFGLERSKIYLIYRIWMHEQDNIVLNNEEEKKHWGKAEEEEREKEKKIGGRKKKGGGRDNRGKTGFGRWVCGVQRDLCVTHSLSSSFSPALR